MFPYPCYPFMRLLLLKQRFSIIVLDCNTNGHDWRHGLPILFHGEQFLLLFDLRWKDLTSDLNIRDKSATANFFYLLVFTHQPDETNIIDNKCEATKSLFLYWVIYPNQYRFNKKDKWNGVRVCSTLAKLWCLLHYTGTPKSEIFIIRLSSSTLCFFKCDNTEATWWKKTRSRNQMGEKKRLGLRQSLESHSQV